MEAQSLSLTMEAPAASARAGVRAGAARALRRAIDIAVAGLILLALSPVLLLLAVAIRLDSPGPAVFRQRRLGRQARPFTVHKFRTMWRDADEGRHRTYVTELIDRKQGAARHGEQRLYKLAGDERVTRFGAALRRWSLDELPQLWNVVRGDMALVGPRPVVSYEAEHYPEWYAERFDVKPGLTGLWQVSGRNERTYEEMVQLDIEYVRRASLRLDLLILAKTAMVVLRRKGVA